MEKTSAERLRQRDREARRLAQRRFDRPLVLEAGAGTGKTTTLVARLLAWSLGPGWERAAAELAARAREAGESGPPEDRSVAARVLGGVVAITFTEAAAAEMAARAGSTLVALAASGQPPSWLEAAALPPGEALAKRARALAGTLDHLAVRTIHAFCRSLLARFPLEAGLHPSLTIDADGQLLEGLARETVEGVLQRAYGAGEDAYLLLAAEGVGPEEIVEALVVLAGEGTGVDALAQDPLGPERLEALRTRLGNALGAFLTAASPLAEVGKRSKKTLEVLDRAEETFAKLEALEATPAALDAFCEAARTDWEESLGRLGDWARGRFNKTESGCLDAPQKTAVTAAAGTLIGLVRHVLRLRPLLLAAARTVLRPLLGDVHRALRSQGVATFAALLTGARDLLAGEPEVRARVRSGIDQLLVDEFQDTDLVQCEILRWIALDGPAEERPGLFLVGDPKQSIYGWRSADLAAYDGFLEEVREAGGEVHPLVESFRSAPVILREVERLVEPVMRARFGLQPRFEPLIPCDRLAASEGFREPPWVPVEHWVSWLPEGEGAASGGATGPRTPAGQAAEMEAAAIARDLLGLRREHGLAWKEAGILLRATGDLDTYLEALRAAGIPYAVGQDKQYYRRREVIDAAALLRAVLDPGDHLALLTLLRSPMVGVPDAALIPLWSRGLPRLLTGLTKPDARTLGALRTLAEEAAREVPAGVPGIEDLAGWEASLVAAVGALAALREAFEAEPADFFVEKVRTLFLQEVLESARYLGAYRLANLERFFRRVLSALEEGGGDVTALLRMLRKSVTQGLEAPEGRPLDGSEDAVQVLTIHRAKGLDFRHVYLPQLHRQEQGGWGPATEVGAVEGRSEYQLFGLPSPGFDLYQQSRSQVEAAERVRLLYVAATRAKERLVTAGTWPAPGGEPPEPEDAQRLLDLLAWRRPGPPEPDALDAAGERGVEHGGALWRRLVPPVDASAREPAAAWEDPAGPEEVARQQRQLDALRQAARQRQARPWSAAASEEAHRELAELLAERRLEARGRPEADAVDAGLPAAETAARRLAMAVGSAVHRVLETFDLEADLSEELERQRRLLSGYLGSSLGEDERSAAVERAAELLAHLGRGSLLGRLRALGDNIVARELPVLLPPEESPQAPLEDPQDGRGVPVGHVAGTVDLLYQDPETGEPVVADFKTDDAEGEDLLARAAAYARQGQVYCRAVQEALELESPPRFELWFLRPDRIVVP